MIDEASINRVEIDLRYWRSQEPRLGRFFSLTFSDNNALLREKLHYYDMLAAKYGKSLDPLERFTLRFVKSEIKQMVRLIYPSVVSRLWNRFIVRSFTNSHLKRKNFLAVEKAINYNFGNRSTSMRKQKIMTETKVNEGQRNKIPLTAKLLEIRKLEQDQASVKEKRKRARKIS